MLHCCENLSQNLRFRIQDSGLDLMRTLLMFDDKLIFTIFFAAKFKQGVYAVSVSGRLPGAVVRDLVSSKNSIIISCSPDPTTNPETPKTRIFTKFQTHQVGFNERNRNKDL